jgi:hypothetical protein
MLSNVGGNDDANRKVTRRMLLLLEGTYLYNDVLFSSFRRRMLERYIGERITEHGLARFLLNDIIRYYRTMCVDFEYKTGEQGKPWGVRNLKLLYSRKLLYFGGVIAVAETAQRTRQRKIDVLLQMLNQTPIARLQSLFGADATDALRYYDAFLAKISDADSRSALDSATPDRTTHSEDFKVLKGEAQHFSWSLERLLSTRYPPSHPIHGALIL